MSTNVSLADAEWIKSSYSEGNGGECVEISPTLATTGTLPIRDSKNPHGPRLTLPTTGWTSFVTALKAGRGFSA